MKRALVLMIALAALPALAVDAERELRAAEDLAVRGRAASGIDAYERLLEAGVDLPGLRYNLGTLYLERGDIGRAVLHLRACLRDAPRHEDARYNLARAEAARADQVDDTGRRALWRAVADNVSSSEAAWVFLALFALLSVLIALLGWTRGRARRAVVTALAVASVPFALAAVALGSRIIADGTREAVVLEDEVSARKGPSDDAAATFVAHPGLHGEVKGEENGYVRVRLSSGLDAWLPERALGRLGP